MSAARQPQGACMDTTPAGLRDLLPDADAARVILPRVARTAARVVAGERVSAAEVDELEALLAEIFVTLEPPCG